MLDAYSVLARWYDALTEDVDYEGLADFYTELIGRYAGDVPKKLLDLGCGTGSLSVLMAERGFEVCGIDTSCEMLSAAQKKAADRKLRVMLAEQDMTKLDCGNGFGAAICCLDGVNYIENRSSLAGCFGRVSEALVPGGLFVFDVNTEYKYENVLSGNAFVYEPDGLFLTWRSYYAKRSGKCSFYLTFFERDGDRWHRCDEYQKQTRFSGRTLSSALKTAGFSVLDVVCDISGTPSDAKSERNYYICKRN